MLKQKNWWIETAQKLSKQTLPIYICNMDLTWAPNLWRGKSHSFLLVGSAKPIRFPANQWNPICLILPNPWSCRKTWFPNGFSWFLLTSLWVFYHGNVPPGEGEISEARTYFGQSKIDLQVEGYLHLGGQDRLPMDSKWVGAKGICLVPRVGVKVNPNRAYISNSAKGPWNKSLSCTFPTTYIYIYIIYVIPKKVEKLDIFCWVRCTIIPISILKAEGADSLSFPTDDADLHPKLGLSFLPLSTWRSWAMPIHHIPLAI